MSTAANTASVQPTLQLRRRERNQWQQVLPVLARDRAAVVGAIVFLLIVLAIFLAPVLAPFDPLSIDPVMRLAPPGTAPYVLGGDELGRDVLSRLLYGGRSSLMIGFLPVVIAGSLGSLIGLLSGYLGGLWDRILMRIMDVMLAFPSILLALGIAAAIGPGLGNVIIALSTVAIPIFARVIRSVTLVLREQDFVTAAVTVGAKRQRVLTNHIIPNILSPVVVLFTLEIGRMIIAGAGLSFLGLGVLPPNPDWGSMLSAGQNLMAVAPHIATIPGLLIFVVTMCLNLMGDGLRDALDPRSRSR